MKAFTLFSLLLVIQISDISSANYNRISGKPKNGDLKIVDGPNKVTGTLMVFRGYEWGMVCDDNWSIKAANVACRQMGMGYAVRAFRKNKFRSSNMVRYMLDDLKCNGDEESLSDCYHAGWAKHNCRYDEHAGLQCVKQSIKKKIPNWNPLSLPLKKEQIDKFDRKNFEIKLLDEEIKDMPGVSAVVVKLQNGEEGSICPDYVKTTVASIICKSLGKGIGGDVIKLKPDQIKSEASKFVMITGRCYGNETSLDQCMSYASPEGIPCKSEEIVAVKCLNELPDLIPELKTMQTSSYLQKLRLWNLECAIEEGCLPEIVNTIIEREPNNYLWNARYLLRFSSVIANIGTGPFIPLEKREKWEWHACHMHYHSMRVFALYNLVDKQKRVVASGHKASFCLEDSECEKGIKRNFQCSNVQENLGTQGISPGCKDSYLHDYDCQWVDVTDVPVGKYELQVSYNPDMLVPESDFSNNGVRCDLIYNGHSATLRNCKSAHPLDLL